MTNTYTLLMSRPASFKVITFYSPFMYGGGKSHMAKWAATTIKQYAARHGIAPSAVEWTCKPVAA